MKVETQFSVFLINKPGVMAAVTEALANAEVNMTALSLVDSGEHGVLRLITDNPDKTREVLTAEHGRWTETQVAVIDLGNIPGAFAGVVAKLAAEGVNIGYAYATSEPESVGVKAVFKIDDMDKAAEALA